MIFGNTLFYHQPGQKNVFFFPPEPRLVKTCARTHTQTLREPVLHTATVTYCAYAYRRTGGKGRREERTVQCYQNGIEVGGHHQFAVGAVG